MSFGNRNFGKKKNDDIYSYRRERFTKRVYDDIKPADNGDRPPVQFEKNFYKEAERITNLTKEEVQRFRDEGEMKIYGNDIPKPIINLDDIQFGTNVMKTLERMGITKPTAIQAQGWPMALSGRDMVGIAQTGSGKTISFVLPALIHASQQEGLRRGDGPIVLVLAPTRELALQIKEVFDEFCKAFRMRCAAVYGGVSAYSQKQELRNGVEVLVATPGRLIDLHEQGFIPLERVSFLILDEADRMLDMGFEPQLRKVIPKTNEDRQTLMWSATWPKEVVELARTFMTDYIQVNIGSTELTSNSKIIQKITVCQERDKFDEIIKVINEFGNNDKIIIFCNKKRTCDDLEYDLRKKKYDVAAIHGDKSQQARDKVISDFKKGRIQCLIATDVAARGLDVKEVKAVINYDFPTNCESYIHRIGRTARGNDAEGTAITFFTYGDRNNTKGLIAILKDANQDVPRELSDMMSKSNYSSYSRNTHSFRRRY
ncbi:DEAD/DEAH box helicase [Spraguea lophii 42_110]|uniref:RNA helicase n=1 Tax=Spraguea lophii (strain 42_110) TaxID=1358809 RepID=S7W9B6_SPRLO|nr:DEAD/DEAH box helicase [Spraguea lophii 42_110]